MDLKVKRLTKHSILPQYQTKGAACFDLHADVSEMPFGEVLVGACNNLIIPTGISFEVPEGHVMLIFSRSGHGFKNDIRLSNCVGVIDSDYRGEVQVKLASDGVTDFRVRHGDRIAQAMLVKLPQCNIIEVDELSETERGANGFGSTGSN